MERPSRSVLHAAPLLSTPTRPRGSLPPLPLLEAELDPLLERLLHMGAYRVHELEIMAPEAWLEDGWLNRYYTAFGEIWTLGPSAIKRLGLRPGALLRPDAAVAYLYRRRLHETLIQTGYTHEHPVGKAIVVYRRHGRLHYALGSPWGYPAVSIRLWLKRLHPEKTSGIAIVFAHPRPWRIRHYEEPGRVFVLALSLATCDPGESAPAPES